MSKKKEMSDENEGAVEENEKDGGDLVEDVPVDELLPAGSLLELGGEGLLPGDLGGGVGAQPVLPVLPVQDRPVLVLLLLVRNVLLVLPFRKLCVPPPSAKAGEQVSVEYYWGASMWTEVEGGA